MELVLGLKRQKPEINSKGVTLSMVSRHCIRLSSAQMHFGRFPLSQIALKTLIFNICKIYEVTQLLYTSVSPSYLIDGVTYYVEAICGR